MGVQNAGANDSTNPLGYLKQIRPTISWGGVFSIMVPANHIDVICWRIQDYRNLNPYPRVIILVNFSVRCTENVTEL